MQKLIDVERTFRRPKGLSWATYLRVDEPLVEVWSAKCWTVVEWELPDRIRSASPNKTGRRWSVCQLLGKPMRVLASGTSVC